MHLVVAKAILPNLRLEFSAHSLVFHFFCHRCWMLQEKWVLGNESWANVFNQTLTLKFCNTIEFYFTACNELQSWLSVRILLDDSWQIMKISRLKTNFLEIFLIMLILGYIKLAKHNISYIIFIISASRKILAIFQIKFSMLQRSLC